MNAAFDWVDTITRVAVLLAIPGSFVAAAWIVYNRWRIRGVAALTGLSALAFGYSAYRWICSRPLTCDVFGASPWFLTGNPYYFTHYVPLLTLMSGVAFGAAAAVVSWRRRESRNRLWPATLLMGVGAAIVAWIVAWVLLGEGSRVLTAAA
jgi:hypothetical protein